MDCRVKPGNDAETTVRSLRHGLKTALTLTIRQSEARMLTGDTAFEEPPSHASRQSSHCHCPEA